MVGSTKTRGINELTNESRHKMGILGTGIEEGLLLKPVKYQWAMDLYDQAVANTWFPNEV